MKFRDLARIVRTVRHLRPGQIVAQLRHLLLGEGRRAERATDVPPCGVREVEVPFLPAPAHAHYDGALEFRLIGRTHRFRDEIDWNYLGDGPLWAFHLHQFDYARAPTLGARARWRLIDHWIEHCADGAGWAPHPISLRILSWGKLLLTPGALDLNPEQEARMHASMVQQATTLAGALETRLQANHLFSNLLSVVFAGLLFEGDRADAWLALASDMQHEIEIQVQGDGSHIEGSPMYHALLLENLLDLLNLARAAGERAPDRLVATLEDAASRMLGAQRVWTHPDAEIALLGDSAFDIAQPPRALEAYARLLGIDPVEPGPGREGVLEDAGVFRMESGELVLIATASPPSPTYQPGHAHCDALSFELSIAGERVVTDTGVTEYIPGALRETSRETASHATLQIGGGEQSEIWAAHRVGGRCEVNVEVESVSQGRLDANCASWSRPQTRHHRSFCMKDGQLVIEDRIEGELAPVRFGLPLAPGLEPKLHAASGARRRAAADGATEDEVELRLVLRSGKTVRVSLPAGVRWTIERRAYFPRFGERAERACLVGRADTFRTGTWRFSLGGD